MRGLESDVEKSFELEFVSTIFESSSGSNRVFPSLATLIEVSQQTWFQALYPRRTRRGRAPSLSSPFRQLSVQTTRLLLPETRQNTENSWAASVLELVDLAW